MVHSEDILCQEVYQRTAFGEEVVEALPDQEAVKAVEQKKPKKRKARRKGESDKR